MAKIENQVFRLRNYKEIQLEGYNQKLKFPGGQEFHIVNDVLYMSGHPVPIDMQNKLIKWIADNPNLFIGDTRIFRNH